MEDAPYDYTLHECSQCYEDFHDDTPEAVEIFTHNYKYEYEGVKSVGEEIVCGYCISEEILSIEFDYSYEYLDVKPKVRYVRSFEKASGFAVWLAVYHKQLDPSCIHPESITAFRKVRDRIAETFPEKELEFIY